jgi:hypothetical protein
MTPAFFFCRKKDPAEQEAMLALARMYLDFYAGGRLGMGSTVNGSAPRRMST